MEDNTNELRLGSMPVTIEEIGPHNAAEFLRHNGCNRPKRLKTVEQYARDMSAGNWHTNPTPICFDENGDLMNGQHRLSAILASRKSYTFLIIRNVPKEAAATMDRGLSRTPSDVAHFDGKNIKARIFKIARGVEFGVFDRTRRSDAELMAAVEKHQEVLDWMEAQKPGGGIKSTSLVIVGRAWHTQDRDRLAEFLKVFKTGVTNGPEDRAAFLLREMTRNPKKWQGRQSAEVFYWKTETAVMAFLERVALTKLVPTKTELFPLPWENGDITDSENGDITDSTGEQPNQPNL